MGMKLRVKRAARAVADEEHREPPGFKPGHAVVAGTRARALLEHPQGRLHRVVVGFEQHLLERPPVNVASTETVFGAENVRS